MINIHIEIRNTSILRNTNINNIYYLILYAILLFDILNIIILINFIVR